MCAYLCLRATVGAGTAGVLARLPVPKTCARICHRVDARLPVFQGSKRQLEGGASSEGPPGVFAPVVAQCGGKQLSLVTLLSCRTSHQIAPWTAFPAVDRPDDNRNGPSACRCERRHCLISLG